MAFGLSTALLVPTAWADDGRTPIYEPTTITEPGSYYLTRNIVSSTDAITVQASPVQLDLNGYEIRAGSGWTGVKVDLDGAVFSVRDGVIRGGRYGLQYFSETSLSAHVRVENVTIVNAELNGIRCTLDGGSSSLVVRNSLVEDSGDRDGIYFAGEGDSSVSIVDTKVLQTGFRGIYALAEQVRVEDCTIAKFALAGDYPGIQVIAPSSAATLSGSAIIRDNIFSRHDGGRATAIETGNEVQATIVNNDIALPDGSKQVDGIYARGIGCLIANNRIAGADEAIYVSGKNHMIQNNHVSGSQNGIWFGTDTGHVYRDNMLRDNDNPTNGAVPTDGDQGGNVL